MPNKIKDGVRRARLWLAARIAPADVDVRDTRTTTCRCRQDILEAVLYGWLEHAPGGRVLAPVTYQLDEMYLFGLVESDGPDYALTGFGERELARMWGPGITPPWTASSWAMCHDHGIYEAFPGEPSDCPDCPPKTIIEGHPAWWSRLLSSSPRHHLL